MNKFEQLIEYVINDEQDKAEALFHEIVVDKSKDIYEEIMAEESDAEKDDHAEKAGEEVKKDIEYDDKMDESVEESELGGSQVDDLIDEVEAEEEGVAFEDEEEEIAMIDVDVEDDDDEDLEDRVVGLEDKLDELMAEFEDLMGQVDDNTDDIEGEQDEISDIDSDTDMEQDEIDDMQAQMDEPVDVNVEVEGLEENVDLVAAPKPVTSTPASKSPVAANSGQAGMDAHPVDFDDGNKGDQGRPTPKYVDQGNTTRPDVKPATKPDLSQAAGVNTKSPIS